MAATGLVSEECYPYTHKDSTCSKRCTSSAGTWKKYKSTPYTTVKTIQAMKQEIYVNGPIEGSFGVYKDFMSYKSGVYIKKSDDHVGAHAIKIIGWGSENGQDYWIV